MAGPANQSTRLVEFRSSPPTSRVDNGLVNLLAELRAHEEQAAKELGQWTEKQQIGGRDGPVEIKVVFVKAPPHPELSP